MRLEPPAWWYGKTAGDRTKAAWLAPLGFLYGSAVKVRFALTSSYRSKLPVICIGNFTVGGAGKTPLALAVAELLRELGASPAFLTRGFGGRLAGPHLVDPDRDGFADVGDEALLLARSAPTFVARNRPEGAKAIEETGASVIIMDDGFQNPSLAKDVSLIAVDSTAGIGNGLVFPAGPLRASLGFQSRRADAVVLIGGDGTAKSLHGVGLPVYLANLAPAGQCEWLQTRPVLAFCGIGRPQKFFDTLKEAGAALAGMRSFPDHHAYTDDDARALLEEARSLGAQLVTTEKDWVRLGTGGPQSELKACARALQVKLIFSAEDKRQITALMKKILA